MSPKKGRSTCCCSMRCGTAALIKSQAKDCHAVTEVLAPRYLFTASCAGTDTGGKVPVRKQSLMIIAKHRLYDKPDHIRICKGM